MKTYWEFPLEVNRVVERLARWAYAN